MVLLGGVCENYAPCAILAGFWMNHNNLVQLGIGKAGAGAAAVAVVRCSLLTQQQRVAGEFFSCCLLACERASERNGRKAKAAHKMANSS